jgi:SPP1 gp7 family putative phage head morphogenesis protein
VEARQRADIIKHRPPHALSVWWPFAILAVTCARRLALALVPENEALLAARGNAMQSALECYMADAAHDWTDEQIERLQRRFRREYSAAEKDMRGKLDKFLADYDKQNSEWKQKVRSGKSKQDEYDAWLKEQAMNREWFDGMVSELSADALRTDQIAMSYINDEIPSVFAENANRAAHEVETGIGRDTHSFDLYDRDTVGRLIAEDSDLLPPLPQPKVNARKDLSWNARKMRSAITQSVLQGESIPHAAERLMQVFKMDEAVATRTARTALTGAENAGRVHSYERAKAIGINLEQEWMATLDQRTRHSHRQLDGQHVPVGKPFKVDGIEINFPADPTAPAEYVYNCRCTLVAWFPDIEQEDNARWDNLPKGMTYEDWKNGKLAEKADGVPIDGNPKTLAGVRRGKPMTFDEANELRGNPDYNMAERAGNRYYEANRRVNEYVNEHGYDDSSELQALRAERDAASRAYQTARREQNGYRVNCQTCVVANEARRRGYNVEATPNNGGIHERLGRDTNLAWIDRATGRHPDYIRYEGDGQTDYRGRAIPTHRRFMQWLDSDGVVEQGARYTIEFWWKGRGGGGHIISLERTEQGLRMYDPQCGETYTGAAISRYFERVKFKTTHYGTTYADAPMLLKVSDYDFDTSICDQILREAR